MSIILPMFAGPTIPPFVTDTPVEFPPSAFDGFTITDDVSTGVRGNIDTGANTNLFAGLGDLAKDSLQRLVGAGVNRLGSDLFDFTNRSIDSIERDSFASLQNQDAAKLARQQARAVKKRSSATKRNVLIVAGVVAALVGGSMLLRR